MLHRALSALPSRLCHEQEGFDRWLCCKKGGTLVLVTSRKSHFASLKTKFTGTGGKKHFSLGNGGMGMKKHSWDLQSPHGLCVCWTGNPAPSLSPKCPPLAPELQKGHSHYCSQSAETGGILQSSQGLHESQDATCSRLNPTESQQSFLTCLNIAETHLCWMGLELFYLFSRPCVDIS